MGAQSRGRCAVGDWRPAVVNSVLALISDKDEDIRRTAIEILVRTGDEAPSII